ncbi:Dienelactone hydrolase family [Seminavis robusta]|uniref:Dienelactone hydrolase family n=1 Tax=Seminavis robusta TaxID=568900 RepID=A0A9N8EF96_9STRA|nr:Dienelactone hydrolase family [Seminavis robusta]|eukprot:Sro1102_g241640.1 Dienelactone hydrolase family (239) ;mRNA; r:35351-36167
MASLPPHLIFKPVAGLAKKAPAVICVQEWWGINAAIKGIAQKIADKTGAEVYLPDLYKGKVGVNQEEASHLMNNLDFKNAVNEMELLCKDIIRKEDADRKVGVCGFCMGGALTLATAALIEKPLDACAPFYGIPPAELCDVAVLKKKTPVQGHFGDKDGMAGFSDKASADKLEETLKNAEGDKEATIFHYPTEGHAFMNDDEFSKEQRKLLKFDGDYTDEARELAWGRLTEFLKKNLF